MNKVRHVVAYEVSNPKLYRQLLDSGQLMTELNERGCELISCVEKKPAVFECDALLDMTHPRIDEVSTFLKDVHDISFELRSVPKITPTTETAIRVLRDAVNALTVC